MRRQWLPVLALAVLLLGSVGVVAATIDSDSTQPPSADAIDGPPAQTTDFEQLAPRGRWNSATGTGEIVLDNESYYAVFQGEGDVETWRDTTGADVTGSILERQAGQGGGQILDLGSAIPADQRTGRYAGDNLTTLVREPRISNLELYNSIGTELEALSELRRDESLLVAVDWNYVEAEDLRLEVIDRDGNVTIQREVLSTTPTADQADLLPAGFDEGDLDQEVQGLGTTGYRTAYWLVDVGEVDDGSYALRVEGVDDLTSGQAATTLRFNVGDDGQTTQTATPTRTEGPTETASATPTAAPTATTESPTTAETTPTTRSPTATTTTERPQTTGANGPGFSAVAAVVALASVLLYAAHRRRH
jgi:PGF-CTERM protein